MASTDELDGRLKIVENIIANAVVLPEFIVDIDSSGISDKTGYWVIGTGKAGINAGGTFVGMSSTASPTLDAHFSEFLIVK